MTRTPDLFQRRHYQWIAATIHELPDELRAAVAEHFASALVGTNHSVWSTIEGYQRERFIRASIEGHDTPPRRQRRRRVVAQYTTHAPRPTLTPSDMGVGGRLVDIIEPDTDMARRLAAIDATIAEGLS